MPLRDIIRGYRVCSIRMLLLDVAIVCFIIATVSFARFLFVITDEMHQFRVDFNTQAGAALTVVQTESSQLSSNLSDLNVTGKVITTRMDDQATSIKALLANAAKESRQTSQQELKTTRDVIKNSIQDTKEAIQTVAQQTTDVAAKAKPVQVNVQPAHDDKPPTVTVQVPATAPQQKPHKRNAWGRFVHFIFHLKD